MRVAPPVDEVAVVAAMRRLDELAKKYPELIGPSGPDNVSAWMETLELVAMRLLERDPGKRYQTAHEVEAVLGACAAASRTAKIELQQLLRAGSRSRPGSRRSRSLRRLLGPRI